MSAFGGKADSNHRIALRQLMTFRFKFLHLTFYRGDKHVTNPNSLGNCAVGHILPLLTTEKQLHRLALVLPNQWGPVRTMTS